jgi:hypothetical protein
MRAVLLPEMKIGEPRFSAGLQIRFREGLSFQVPGSRKTASIDWEKDVKLVAEGFRGCFSEFNS